MSNNFSDFSDILKFIVENSGKNILNDKKKVNGMLSDLAPGDKFSGEKKLLNAAYSCNAVNILLNADSDTSRHSKAAESAKGKLEADFISSAGADIIVKSICTALGWNIQDISTASPVKQQEPLAAAAVQNATQKAPYGNFQEFSSAVGAVAGSLIKAFVSLKDVNGNENKPNAAVDITLENGKNELLGQTAALLNKVIDIKKSSVHK